MKFTFILLALTLTLTAFAQEVPKAGGGSEVAPFPEIPADAPQSGAGLSPAQPQPLPAGQLPPQVISQPQPQPQASLPPQQPLEMAADLVKCPIIDRSAEVRRAIAPSAEQIRTELRAAIQRASQYRNPACSTVGQNLTNLQAAFTSQPGQASTCVASPQTCASMIQQTLPILAGCTEDRENLGDMATSIALYATAGSPAGMVALGVSAIRSVISLFSGRSERRQQRAEEQRVTQQRREVIEAAASCAMMTFYQVGVCAPAEMNRVGTILDNINPSPTCNNRAEVAGMSIEQKITALHTLDSCTRAPAANNNACFAGIGQTATPALTGQPPERAACLVEEVTSISRSANYSQNDIPQFLKLARRHHTEQIIQIKNRLAASEIGDSSGISDRTSLALHCFYGKVSRSISSQNVERAITPEELTAQDRADTGSGGVLRNVPESSRVLLADNAAEVDRICNSVDNCLQANPQNPTIAANFGPAPASIRDRMCNGVGKFLDYGTNTLNGRLSPMGRAIATGGQYGQNCAQPSGTRSSDGSETSIQ
ncbi:MAG: hypothetical protein V4598_15395 [Bdellovibrionota bacterium]